MKLKYLSLLAFVPFALTACQTTGDSGGITVDTSAQLDNEAKLAADGWTQVAGKPVHKLLSGSSYSYNNNRGSDVNLTFEKNGLLMGDYKHESGSMGKIDMLWTIEKGEFLCTWNDDNKDSCSTIWTKGASVASVTADGRVNMLK